MLRTRTATMEKKSVNERKAIRIINYMNIMQMRNIEKKKEESEQERNVHYSANECKTISVTFCRTKMVVWYDFRINYVYICVMCIRLFGTKANQPNHNIYSHLFVSLVFFFFALSFRREGESEACRCKWKCFG